MLNVDGEVSFFFLLPTAGLDDAGREGGGVSCAPLAIKPKCIRSFRTLIFVGKFEAGALRAPLKSGEELLTGIGTFGILRMVELSPAFADAAAVPGAGISCS